MLSLDYPCEPGSDDGGDVLQASLNSRGRVVSRVAGLAIELQSEIKRRKHRGSVKAVIERRNMDAMIARLERRRADLHFAYSLYVEARGHKQVEYIRRYMEEVRQSKVRLINCTQTSSELEEPT